MKLNLLIVHQFFFRIGQLKDWDCGSFTWQMSEIFQLDATMHGISVSVSLVCL